MMNQGRWCGAFWVALSAALGCNAFDDEPPGVRTFRVVPVDERVAVQQEVTPPPVSGGTLLALRTPGSAASVANDGSVVEGTGISSGGTVASDPARDRVTFVDSDGSLKHHQFPEGSQPGRLVEDAQGFVHIVLRGAGKLVMLDRLEGVVAETELCSAPRGLAYDAAKNEIVVACAEGLLLRATPAEAPHEVLELPLDLRDVVVAGDVTYVSRFRSAEVLTIVDSELTERVALPSVLVDRADGAEPALFKAEVAWRMVADPGGGVLIVHQRALVDVVDAPPENEDEEQQAEESPYGGSSSAPDVFAQDCRAIVQSAVTRVDAAGALSTSDSVGGVVLPVDIAISADRSMFVIANAGLGDSERPMPSNRVVAGGDDFGSFTDFGLAAFNTGSITTVPYNTLQGVAEGDVPTRGCVIGDRRGLDVPATAVVFDGPTLIAQFREPATLASIRWDGPSMATLQLGGGSVRDSGHEVFHRDSGGGIACASCHPEGGDDGHVWTFADVGERRTQNLAIPLAETAPFHWDGSLPKLDVLMDEVFVRRMGGIFQSAERMETLEDWMFEQRRVQLRPRDVSAAERGKKLFESAGVGCATCHSGSALTDNKSYDVGTSAGERLQVPSLVGISLHPPFMHNGCAQTLDERFEKKKCGGGDAHGVTSDLASDEVADLVAYMKTL